MKRKLSTGYIELTSDIVRSLFAYQEGELYRRKQPYSDKISDKPAGCVKESGYVYVYIKPKLYYAHRLIFLLHYGYFPAVTDHIDGNRKNNKIENLREVNNIQNGQNYGRNSSNTSGYTGVTWAKRENKWNAKVMVNRKTINLGLFAEIEKANEAVLKFKTANFGEYMRR